MLKIAVFSGGTGSVALQNGISSLYDINTIKMDIIVNAYDNGKSTGACRRIFDNKILGPSDVRKNQLLQYSIQYKQEIKNKKSKYNRLYQLFNIRLSAQSPSEYYSLALKEISMCNDILGIEICNYLIGLLNAFFYEDGVFKTENLREAVKKEVFEDFSISNIFYAACASENGNSLETAADKMAEILNIPNNVHLISDVSLILKAETESGYIIHDEGDIVTWDNPQDKIVRAMLLKDGEEYLPCINENSSNEAHSIEKIVLGADIIIFSSGTQWSSLIPTYMHRGFRELIDKSNAKKYLIMNNIEDHDSLGVGACELCEILEEYLNLDDITIVLNEYAAVSMKTLPEKYHAIYGKLSEPEHSKHIPEELVKVIMTDYYKIALNSRYKFFDLDGTLWNDQGTICEKEIGKENLRLFDGMILTGNSISHVMRVYRENAPIGKETYVFADYGNTSFSTNNGEDITYLTDKYFLNDEIYEKLNTIDEFKGKMTMRGHTVITIKPVENRELLIDRINQMLGDISQTVVARSAGKTSIDIMNKEYTKASMLLLILSKLQIECSDVLFVGNELAQGSEKGIIKTGVKTLQVNDVYDSNIYLRTLTFAKMKTICGRDNAQKRN